MSEPQSEQRSDKRPGKRKRGGDDSIKQAYESVSSFKAMADTDYPRDPHRFFQESYEVNFDATPKDQPMSISLNQVVHRHVNDLCVVTAGSTLPEGCTVVKIDFVVQEAPACSAAEKRKRQAKMLRGQKVQDAVSPSTVIAELELSSGEKLPVRACVWGTIIEVNKDLTPAILHDDPLLEGFFAVILPSGKFPPKEEDESKES